MRTEQSLVLFFLLALSPAVNAQSEATHTSADPTAPVHADAANRPREIKALPPVVVTATRSAQSSFHLPLSIDQVDQTTIEAGNAMVNLSESLGGVPGIVVQSRQNYAQDLQISSRGFGARSTFGARGLRLYVDGIPATMPDGQGQTSHIDLTSASRIEVLGGSFSALYGNSSGGVIAVFTEDGKPGFALSPLFQAGSFGFKHYGLKASGQQGDVNYVVGTSRFTTDGYRSHSAASRNTGNAKLRIIVEDDSILTLIGNSVDMPHVQDPLGLTRSELQANPCSVTASASLFNTRKSVSQQQTGLNYEKIIDENNTLNAMLYAGNRSTTQFLAVPQSAQLAPSNAGGVIDLARQYGGVDVRWTQQQKIGAGKLQWTAGLSYDKLNEDRRGYENFSAGELGVQGTVRRNESNTVYNIDEYFQTQWEPNERWLLLAGVRNSSIQVRSMDHYTALGNGDDSGSVSYHSFNPMAGATYKFSDQWQTYVSFGKGFETPTLNELSYRPSSTGAAGFNFSLQPSTSHNYEWGMKRQAGNFHANLALFHIDTDKELTVLSNAGGRAVYQNAGQTRRDGMEAKLQNHWDSGLGLLLSASLLRASYAEDFCNGTCSPSTSVAAGHRIPGVPQQTVFGELSWRHSASGFDAALEAKYGGRIAVDDINSDFAPAYFVVNLRAAIEQKIGRWRLKEFIRIDNLANRRYTGSVIVNESNQRFFEPAPGRNYLAGISAVYSW